MEKILEINSLAKSFGNKKALDGVNLEIPMGQISGLLGPNASGKTTLLKTIAGLYHPSNGSIAYYNNAAAGAAARATISFCPDTMVFPPWMKVKDAFTFFSDLYPDYSADRAEKLIDILELDEVLNNKVSSLSKGMKERLSFAVCLSRECILYLLDEPLDGIDPVGKMKVIDAILAMKSDNASILISTHLVKDIERILDNVFFLSKGKIIFSGSCDQMREEKNKTVEEVYLEVFSNEIA